jgi:hypothetical protein
MASIHQDGDRLRVTMSTWEKVAALHGDLEFPVGSIDAVEVVSDPLTAVTGVRAPGLHIPSRTKIGTWRQRGRRTFAVARAGTPAIRIGLRGQRYQALVVSVPDAASVADTLRVDAR